MPIANPVIPDPRKKLRQQYDATQGAYGASVDRMQTAQKQAASIPIPAPVVREGRSWSPNIANPATNAAVAANQALGSVVRGEQDKQAAMVPDFNKQAAGFRNQATVDRATATTQGANKLLAGVGAAPIAIPPPALAKPAPRPTVTPTTVAPSTPSGATPAPNTPGAMPNPATQVKNPASASYFVGSNGVRREVGTDGNIVGSNTSQVGVGQQSFGTLGKAGAVATESFGAIARPNGTRVPSTFGLPVNDPRMDDQTAVIARPQGRFGDPAQRSEYYANKEDREASQKLASDIESRIFALSLPAGRPGRDGRAAKDAIAGLTSQQAALVNGQAGRSSDAIENRNNNETTLTTTGLQEIGANERAKLLDATAREGNQLSYRAKMAEVGKDMIERPTLRPDGDGYLQQVTGTIARPVLGTDGRPVQDYRESTGRITPQDQYKAITDQLVALQNTPPLGGTPEEMTTYNGQLQSLAAQRDALLSDGGDRSGERIAVNPQTGEKRRWNAQTRQWDSMPSGATQEPPPGAIATLRQQPQLAAQFDAKYGEGASKRFLK